MTDPYWSDGNISLYCGKFEDFASELLEAGADAVVTDPPYNQTSLAWDRWPHGWPSLAAEISNQLWSFGSFRMFWDHADEFKAAGWKNAQELVWEKHNGSGFKTDRFRRVHELCAQFYRGRWDEIYHVPPKTQDAVKKVIRRKGKPAHMNDIQMQKFTSEDGGDRLMRSVIKLRSMNGRAINETEKPVPLVKVVLGASVPAGGMVVDIFAGSGSTGLAARQLGMKAILVEQRESQCEKTALRLERETTMTLEV